MVLWPVFVVLVIVWFVAWVVFHVAGGLIHLLLVIALIVLIYDLTVRRRTA